MPFKTPRLVALLAAAMVQHAAMAHDLQPGQQLTFVLSDSKAGGEKVAEFYFSKAFPLAQANGMRELTTFKVQRTLWGERKPQGSGLYLWPSREAAQRTRVSQGYVTELRPLRTQAWNELQSVDLQVVAPLSVTLDRTKIYTAALVWARDAAAYDELFRASQPRRDELGARTVLELPASRYENLKDGETTPPGHVVLLEWPNAEAAGRYFADPAFVKIRELHKRNRDQVEWYQLGFWE
jgi:uncharacterized protein (DUF1330 family)